MNDDRKQKEIIIPEQEPKFLPGMLSAPSQQEIKKIHFTSEESGEFFDMNVSIKYKKNKVIISIVLA